MAYLIDGHNLIGQLPDISLSDPDDEAKLVQKLIGFSARQSKRIVVVFDSGLPGGKSRLSTGQVEVIFASARSSADDVMKERIKRARDPGQWVVVSNDRVVLDAARARRMTTVTSADFAVQLRQPPLAKSKHARSADAREADDVHVSPAEVEAWLEIFKAKSKPDK
jgi:predicted RNA-binding protein with PIN domain